VSDRQKIDWLHKGVAAAILLIVFVIYNATKAPTLSFWDCGEFITCSYVLGIPHPPGSPLYVLLGRLFTLIPFHTDIAARVNMLSAMTGAVAAMLAFLVTFRLIRLWWSGGQFTGWKRAAAYFGGIVGASMFAFGKTQWNNSMEAEVYTSAMLLMILIIWLTLRWLEHRDERSADGYLLLLMYLGFLSIGIHMTTFLIMPAIFLIVIFFSSRLRHDLRFYITCILLYTISFSVDVFLYANAVWLIILLAGSFFSRQYVWRFSLLLILAAVIGLSCQLYTPIRSSQNPIINQNDPSSSFTVFRQFLERKQYGGELMVVRALKRRGTWANQFGTHERMGFWGFFSEQYGINGRKFAFLFVVGILGLFELARRRPRIGWPFLLMVLLGTVFLVWYMNFADGTMQNPVTGDGHIEVRNRDYFFTPGFVLFGIAIGMGVAGFMEMARESLQGKLKSVKPVVMGVVSVLVLLAAVPVQANYFYCDRSRNYTPYDFAYNLLASCDRNAILFNGGDNDTFPVWCLQNVYHVRPDVTSINLSLSNLGWYIKQIRDYMHVPLRWNDTQIDAMHSVISKDGRMTRIQDQVVDEILAVEGRRRPINFALTVGMDAIRYKGRSLKDNLVLQGMVYRLDQTAGAGSIDMAKNRDLFWNKLQFRSLADSTIYLDERTRSLSGNYTTALLLMADSLRRIKDFDPAIEITKKALEIVPFDYQTYNYLTQLYVEAGQDDKIPGLLDKVPPSQKRAIYYVWGLAEKYMGDREQAAAILRATLDSFPSFNDAFREYTLLLYEDKQMDSLKSVVQRWLVNNPHDEQARRIMQELFHQSSPLETSGSE
jgi:tetratricopeptide (TPR) repeat protein